MGKSTSESVKMLSSVAKEASTWLVGGVSGMYFLSVSPVHYVSFLGSIPERDAENDKLYNTCTVYNPNGLIIVLQEVRTPTHSGFQATLSRCIARFTCSTSTFLARSNSRLNPVPRLEPL